MTPGESPSNSPFNIRNPADARVFSIGSQHPARLYLLIRIRSHRDVFPIKINILTQSSIKQSRRPTNIIIIYIIDLVIVVPKSMR